MVGFYCMFNLKKAIKYLLKKYKNTKSINFTIRMYLKQVKASSSLE